MRLEIGIIAAAYPSAKHRERGLSLNHAHFFFLWQCGMLSHFKVKAYYVMWLI